MIENFLAGTTALFGDPITILIFVFGVIGGMLFGYIGDKCGRKNALFLSILLMSIATTLMGCLPSYDMIGVAAPIMLFLVRLCQGLSVGGQVCFMPASKEGGKECIGKATHTHTCMSAHHICEWHLLTIN